MRYRTEILQRSYLYKEIKLLQIQLEYVSFLIKRAQILHLIIPCTLNFCLNKILLLSQLDKGGSTFYSTHLWHLCECLTTLGNALYEVLETLKTLLLMYMLPYDKPFRTPKNVTIFKSLETTTNRNGAQD